MDIKILGIGIAVTFAMIALSAITLYLAFRIKETFREEKSLKIQLAKTFFLIGILFLAGGMFYFFAQAMYPQKLLNDTNASEKIESGSFAKKGSVFFGVSYVSNIKPYDNYTVSFKTYNPSSKLIRNASIKLVGLSLLGAMSNFEIESDSLDLRDIPPGETSGYLVLKSPSYPTVLEGTLIFQSQDTDTVTESVKINVLEKEVIPSPTPTPSPNSSSLPRPVYIIWPSESDSTSAPAFHSNPTSTSSPSTSNSNSTSPTATPVSNSTSNSTGSTNTSIPAPTADPNSSPSPTPSPTADPNSSPSPTPSPTADPNSSPSPTPTTTPPSNTTP